MQSIGDLGIKDSDFITAEELRNMTATPEEIFEERIENLKESFMQTMVKKATNEGVKKYAVDFVKENTDELIERLTSEFEELGYKISTEEATKHDSEVIVFTISWEA